jgi:hypothetical protein
VPSLIDSEVNKWREDRAKTSTAEREEQYRNLRRSQRLQSLSYLTVFSVDFEPEPEFNLSNVVKTPNTHRQAMNSQQSAKWRQAEYEEMEGLRKARVAIECDLPPGDVQFWGNGFSQFKETRPVLSNVLKLAFAQEGIWKLVESITAKSSPQ